MSYKVKDSHKGLTIHTSKKGETVSIVLDEKVSQKDLKWLYQVKDYPGVEEVKSSE